VILVGNHALDIVDPLLLLATVFRRLHHRRNSAPLATPRRDPRRARWRDHRSPGARPVPRRALRYHHRTQCDLRAGQPVPPAADPSSLW
jgi:hypothetical protein